MGGSKFIRLRTLLSLFLLVLVKDYLNLPLGKNSHLNVHPWWKLTELNDELNIPQKSEENDAVKISHKITQLMDPLIVDFGHLITDIPKKILQSINHLRMHQWWTKSSSVDKIIKSEQLNLNKNIINDQVDVSSLMFSKNFHLNLTEEIQKVSTELYITHTHKELENVFQKHLRLTLKKLFDPNSSYCRLILILAFSVLFILSIEQKIEKIKAIDTNNVYINLAEVCRIILSMLNVKGEELIPAFFSDDDKEKKYDWLVERPSIIPPSTYCVYSVYDAEMYRLATFSKFPNMEGKSFVNFSQAGFYATGNGLLIKCIRCGKEEVVTIIEDCPSDKKYHKEGCSFIQANDKAENHVPAIKSPDKAPSSSLESSTGATGVNKLGLEASTGARGINNSRLDSSTGATAVNSSSLESSTGARGINSSHLESVAGATGVNSSHLDSITGATGVNSSSLDSIAGATGITNQPFTKRPPDKFDPHHQPQTNNLSEYSDQTADIIETDSAIKEMRLQDGNSGQQSSNVQYPIREKSLQSRTPQQFSYFNEATNDICLTMINDLEATHIGPSMEASGSEVNQHKPPQNRGLLGLKRGGTSRPNSPSSGSDTSSGYFPIPDIQFDDSDLFKPELASVSEDGQKSRNSCLKNKGHYAYCPMHNFKMDTLPAKIRHPDVLTFFELVSKLTVRICVNRISKDRPASDSIESNQKNLFGTGFAVSEPESFYHIQQAAEHTLSSHMLKRMKKHLHIKKEKKYIYIRTVKHLVYDNMEAENTTVEFFYDNPNRKQVVIAKGVSVHHSLNPGDMTSILVCKTSEVTIASMIHESSSVVDALAKNFSQSIKADIMSRVFIISHPHGGEKVFCFGDYVMVKYQLTQENVNDEMKMKIVKINNSTPISGNTSNILKAMLYTAETCIGCIGAPVITFVKTSRGDIILDILIHNGVMKERDSGNGLSASTLRVLTQDDVANHGQINIVSSVTQRMNEEADKSANQVAVCPIYTVLKSPTYPAYVTYNARLNSYPPGYIHVHTSKDLAKAGFFNAEYDDCVRCFHCGLGLKSWKPGDIIHVEHQRNRPDCQFLQLKLREEGITSLASQSAHEQVHEPSSMMVNIEDILLKENMYLQQIVLCKVCGHKPVKDLFLPCADLVACLECSQLLTHCPACKSKILATVTTYFG